jgi:hypothetical protein
VTLQPTVERVFSEDLERELLDHPGKWVGLVDDVIVAVGDNPAEVLSLAKKAGHAHVLLHHVPEHGKAYFFYA